GRVGGDGGTVGVVLPLEADGDVMGPGTDWAVFVIVPSTGPGELPFGADEVGWDIEEGTGWDCSSFRARETRGEFDLEVIISLYWLWWTWSGWWWCRCRFRWLRFGWRWRHRLRDYRSRRRFGCWWLYWCCGCGFGMRYLRAMFARPGGRTFGWGQKTVPG